MGHDKLAGPVSGETWTLSESTLDELRVRVQEAASWCLVQQYPEDPTKILRSPELEPPKFAEMQRLWEDVPLFEECIQHVFATRSRLLDERMVERVSLDSALQAGRILGHDLASCTADQLPHAMSAVFDLWDNIGWDSWVHCLPSDSADRDRLDHTTCLAWIPERLIPLVDGAMISCTDCVLWIPAEHLSLR